MNNKYLEHAKKSIRTLAKRYKSISYSTSLVLMFAMLGVNAFTEETITKQEINVSVVSLENALEKIKINNIKKTKKSVLELVQLMEQGNQVVKSPWASWQFGINYFYDNWNGSFSGRGNKKEKYLYEGIFTRGEWWKSSVSPESKTYKRISKGNDLESSLNNNRDGYNYGLVRTRKNSDKGTAFVIQPTIKIGTPPLPELSINPKEVKPSVSFRIPDITTDTFSQNKLSAIEPNVFNPPLLQELSIGFSQDSQGPGFYGEPNVIVNQSNAKANSSGTEIKINDAGFEVLGAFTFEGIRGRIDKNQEITASGTVAGEWISEHSNYPNGDYLNGTSYINNSRYVGAYAEKKGYRYNQSTAVGITAVSPQTVFNITQYQVKNKTLNPANDLVSDPIPQTSITGDWTLKNLTMTPFGRTEGRVKGGPIKPDDPLTHPGSQRKTANTLRFISLNPTGIGNSLFAPVKVEFDGTLNLYGRNINDLIGKEVNGVKHGKGGRPHLTIGMEVQAIAGQAAVLVNKGTINLERESAKKDGDASYLIGMSAMIEGYTDYSPYKNMVRGYNGTMPVTYRPWASEMRNEGTINVKSINSIGIDFAEFGFNKFGNNAHQEGHANYNPYKHKSYDKKGSLNIYVKVGNINLSSEDRSIIPGIIEGSYGIRVPNVFAKGISLAGTTDPSKNSLGTSHYDEDGIYYDETIIDGKNGEVNIKGSHNVGVSISKNITGSGMYEVLNPYSEHVMPGKGTTIANQTPNGIGDVIYGEGRVSVYDYQTGKNADGDGLEAKTKDLAQINNIGRYDEHTKTTEDPIGNIYNLNIVVDGMENIGFLRNSDYMKGEYSNKAMALSKKDFRITNGHVENINFGVNADGGVLFRTDRYGINLERDLTDINPGNANITNKKYNIVMLANGTKNPNDIVVPKVKNTGSISFSEGGQNVIGLMAYNGGKAEAVGDITIKNSASSIALAINGKNTARVSEGNSSGTINVTGESTVAVYNRGGKYELFTGEINVTGKKAVAVYAAENGTDKAVTKLGAGEISATGEGAVALYASGGSNIELNGTVLNISSKGLLFYGSDNSKLNLTGNATANIASGGTAFYVKNATGSPLESIITSTSTGNLTVNLTDNSTLIVAEGNGGTSLGEQLSNLSNSSTTGLTISGSTNYIPYKAYRLPLNIDRDVNLDNIDDIYLNSEFSSSSITLEAGKEIKGSAAITNPIKIAEKSKVGIAQKNTTVGVGREDVVLTNNGTINLSGSGMVGIAGEFTEIYNNSIIKAEGADSIGVITSNGGIATNTGEIAIGNGGVGLAGINYLGVTDSPSLAQPTTGEGFIEIVHNGEIVSTGVEKSSVGIVALDLKERLDTKDLIVASRASKVTLGKDAIIDVSSAEGNVGVYSKGVYRGGAAQIIDNGSKIRVGKSGIGMYVEGTEINAGAGIIESLNSNHTKGIYTDSDVVSAKEIKVLGDKSIGIHNYGVNSLYPTDKSRNYVKIKNLGKITLGDSANLNDPSIGIYTRFGEVEHNNALIEGGKKVVGIYSDVAQAVKLINGKIKLSNESIGIYKKQGSLNIDAKSIIETGNKATVVYSNNGAKISNNSEDIKIGDNSYGFVILDKGTNEYTSSSTSNFRMGSGSVYLYKAGTLGNAKSETTVKSQGSKNVAFFAEKNARIENAGIADLRDGLGNIGAFSKSGGIVENTKKIIVGASDIKNEHYSVGMAAQAGGKVINRAGAIIEVTKNYGIGMFAEGAGTRVENYGTIDMVSAGELKGTYGMYLTEGAYGLNEGIIKSGTYSADANKENMYGIAVLNGAIFENKGIVDIDARNSYGVYIREGIIKNYGTIRISGTNSIGIRNKGGKFDAKDITEADLAAAGAIASNGAKPYSEETNGGSTTVEVGSTKISTSGVATIDGKVIPLHDLRPGPKPEIKNFAFSNVGIYIDTLGRTKPIEWLDGYNPTEGHNDLIIGSEVTELTNSRAIKIGKDIMTPFIKPYLDSLKGFSKQDLNTISASLTWTAQAIEGRSGMPEEAILAKIPYTDFVDKTENAWNFADGLEQRYDKNELGSREKKLFNKLNLIGKNEQVLLTQAYDEMMGHQYANIQQRIHSTGRILDKEFDYLKDEWRTASKDSNKVKVFGMKGEYSTDTAGVIDYKNNAYGVAYVGENETVKLGKSSGWYTGLVHNKFNFKDIGNSKEEMLQAKLGLFKSTAFDDNNSLNWTISGEVFIGYNKMHRRFLVVDEIFNARSRYWSYGVALKNELSKTFRLSEDFSLRGYASLKAEYGRFQTIKEKSGEVRLEIKANDYISVKPEIGGELIYKTPLSGRNFFNAKLGVKYDNELGRVGDAKNKARVAHTKADWFNIRGEKEDRRGNIGADLSLGWDNEAYGITANIGYDTKGKNRRAGLGLRVIF